MRKYKNVGPVVDTGAVLRKQPPPKSANEIANRRRELFKRVKAGKVANLLRSAQEAEVVESVYDFSRCEESENEEKSVVSVVSSDAPSVVGAKDALVLDLRSHDDFKHSRIVYGVNHPGSLVARDLFSPELVEYKRKLPGRYLVVYHVDDRQSAFYATLLAEKGWEEVYIIEGGFSEFKTLYPELIESL